MRLPVCVVGLLAASCHAAEPPAPRPVATPPAPHAETPRPPRPPADPLDLDFEAPLDPAVWNPSDAAIAIDQGVAHHGSASLRIHSPTGGGEFQEARAVLPLDRVRGHAIRITGWVRGAELRGWWDGMWGRVDGPDHAVYQRANTFDRGLTGTFDWTQVEIELAVPPSATEVTFGGVIAGTGDLWLDDVALVIGEAISEEQYRSPIAVDGTVVDAERRPLAGMTVRATMSTDDRAVLVAAAGTSDAEGRFHLELPAGSYALAATSPDHAAGIVDDVKVVRLHPRSAVELRAGGAGHVMSGRVLDLHGRPVAGALAGATRLSPDPSDALLLVESDARGAYRVMLPAGHYAPVALPADGLRVARPVVDLAGDRRVDIVAARDAELAEPPTAAVQTGLRAVAAPLATVEAGHGFDDLAPLGRIVGGARLVALGEATHGTREFSQLKHRVLEYLVDRLGFTVFLMEASVGEAAALDDYIVTGKGDLRAALRTAVYRVWYTEEVLAMAEWMRAWNADPAHVKKLRFYGVDVQSPSSSLPGLLAYLERVDPAEAARARDYLAPMREYLGHAEYRKLSPAVRSAMHDGIRGLLARFDGQRARWARATSTRDWMIARKAADVMRQRAASFQSAAGAVDTDARDAGMAENAAWVLEQLEPGARGVLWAHNAHISRAGYDGVVSVGQRLAARYGARYVAFGFVWNQGGFRAREYGGPEVHEVGPEAVGGIGATFAGLGLPLAVIDLRAARGAAKAWLAAPHRTRAIGALFTTEAHMDGVTRLSNEFDAALFIDRTTASRPL